MLYYSNECRKSHIEKIDQMIKLIGEVPGNIITYQNAITISRYLTQLQTLILDELTEPYDKGESNND